MTATIPPPPAARPSTPGRASAWPRENSAPHRTLLALLATALGITPLKALLSDNGWLFEAWLTMLVAIAPAALLRLRRAPSALDIWPGVLLLVPWLTILFVPHHAWGGFIPTGATFSDVANLMDSLHRTARDEVAPIQSTDAVRLVVCALVGLLAALVDLIAVVGRRGALAGVPLLVVFTVSGAVPRSAVGWGWFVLAALGFLILLGLDAIDDLRHWGRRISRRGGTRGRPGLTISAQRIGIAAIVVALFVPLLVPDHPRNLLADAFHNGNGGGVGGFGAGSGSGTAISPFVALKGQLDRNKSLPLVNVEVVRGPTKPVPFYLKTNVLDRYTADVGWSVSGHGASEPLDLSSDFATEPPSTPQRVAPFQTKITVSDLTGNAPVFALPTSVDGVDAGTTWSPQDGLLLGKNVHKGQTILESFNQPDPTVAELQNSPAVEAGAMRDWLTLPTLPSYVTQLVDRLTGGTATAYDKARAVFNYFADPKNGFVYSLKTEPGDSGSALVDFLKNGSGYCQQYAAAMAVMLRDAGIPARVALGYMHSAPDPRGRFTVTTLDAHAWVEAYFAGVGWVPFDPTPAAGLSGGRASDLQYAPHAYSSSADGGNLRPSAAGQRSSGAQPSATTSAPAAVAGPSGQTSNSGAAWFGLSVLIALLIGLVPAGARATRRRQRFLAARHGDADALWAELSDTAIDLGYVWSPARSPRQVSAWLARDARTTSPKLDALAAAVEHRRYAPPGSATDTRELVRGLHDVTGELKSRRSRSRRFRAMFWPASLGWGRRLGSIFTLPRHRG
jgi:transglutaminase-like putative cysteine protease